MGSNFSKGNMKVSYNNAGGSGGGGGNGGSGNGSNGNPRGHYSMGTEQVVFKLNDQTYMKEYSWGTKGWMEKSNINARPDERPGYSLHRGTEVGKTTGHPDGNLHHHGSHWGRRDGKDHGFEYSKK